MKLSKKAYYGLRASLALASVNTPVSIHSLAETEGISESYLEKILQDLRKNGIVTAGRGTKGGYTLANQSLSAWDIIVALEGPLKIYPGLQKGTLPCFHPTHCQTNTVFRTLEESLESTLKNISLTSLIQ